MTVLDIWLGGGDPKLAKSITIFKNGALKGLASVKFDAMEAWFEEDEQIFIHPRDPYKVDFCDFKLLRTRHESDNLQSACRHLAIVEAHPRRSQRHRNREYTPATSPFRDWTSNAHIHPKD